MIPIVFSSPIPIANEQARLLQAQAQAQPQTTPSSQTVPSSNSSQSATSQGSGSSSAVCLAPYDTPVAEMTGTVTSGPVWFDMNIPSHPLDHSASAIEPSTSSFTFQQQGHQHQVDSTQQQPIFDQHHMAPKQRQMLLNTPRSQPASRNSQSSPTSYTHVHPRPQDNSRHSNTH
jgi:hypothetical protein